MNRVKQTVQIRPNSLTLPNTPIVDIDSLPVSTSCSSYPSTSISAFNPSVRNKYIMKRFAHDLTQFALPKIPSKYKLDNNNNIKSPPTQLSVKGRSISKLSCSSTSTATSRKSCDEKENEVNKTICLEGCRYDVVRRIALELRFCEVTESDFWNILWTDSPISMEKAFDMRRLQQQNSQHSFYGPTKNAQKTNHFPGMHEICRKDRLAKNLNRMQKVFPEDYQFYPQTWSLPSDIPDLLSHVRTNKSQVIICKPDSGCQGKGIFLVRNLKKMNPFAKHIAQIYIPNPLLIDGFKFDLRIYILITSCDPLRMYIYNEGIARFATVKYAQPNDHNVDVVFMHLTNYSLNKYSQSYVPDPEGSKRKLSTVYGYLLEKGFNVEKLVEDIDDIIIKTVMAAQPTLKQMYNSSFPQENPGGSSCFELLGFDILIDDTLKPWLLEVNLSPSFNLDLTVDAEVKEALLRDTFNKIFLGTLKDKNAAPSTPSQKGVLNLSPSQVEIMDKAGHSVPKSFQKQYYHETLNQGNFRLIYPTDNCFKYAEFLNPILNISPINEMAIPISRRGTSFAPFTAGTTNDTNEQTQNGDKNGVASSVVSLPQPQTPQLRKVFQSARATKSSCSTNTGMLPSTPSRPMTRLPVITFKPSTEPPSPNTSGGSESSFVSPFNQLPTNPVFEKGDPSHLTTASKTDCESKLDLKVLERKVVEAEGSKKKVKRKKKKELVISKPKVIPKQTVKKSVPTSAPTLKRSYTSSSSLPQPVEAHEEDDRKEMMKKRERTIRQLGIEGKIFEMMQETGTLTMEEDLIYNKIYSEEEFLANRNGESTLLQPRTNSMLTLLSYPSTPR